MHNLGAKRIKDFLPDEIHLRLGLSATPERQHDPVGTSTVLEYFGGIQYQYTIEQAIADGRLCPYLYYPHIVHLNDDEADRYWKLTKSIAALMGTEMSDDL
ncbi:helicase, partial [Arthrospira platensis SPKY2]